MHRVSSIPFLKGDKGDLGPPFGRPRPPWGAQVVSVDPGGADDWCRPTGRTGWGRLGGLLRFGAAIVLN